MKIGLCAWSFTGAHREANREIDPHTPEGLTRLAQDNQLQVGGMTSLVPAAP